MANPPLFPTAAAQLLDYEAATVASLIVLDFTSSTGPSSHGMWFSLQQALDCFAPVTDIPFLLRDCGLHPSRATKAVTRRLRAAGLHVGTRRALAGGMHTPVWRSLSDEIDFRSARNALPRGTRGDPRLREFDLSRLWVFHPTS